MSVQDIEVASKIWGKDITALKGKMARCKPIKVASDFVKIPKELIKLHKNIFLTTDVFFVNKIPFFLTLSRAIYFTAVNHLMDRTVPQIFKAFKEIYQHYLHRGFKISAVHADGESISPRGRAGLSAGGRNRRYPAISADYPESGWDL